MPMSPSPVSGAFLAGCRQEELPDLFDRAWHSGSMPRIEDYAARLGTAPADCALREELVRIDLEYRWRNHAAKGTGTLLEDYVNRLPPLAGQVSAALASWESGVRHSWGERPGGAEYLSRFPALAADLPVVLARVDTELAREQTRVVATIREAAPLVATPVAAAVSVADFLAVLQQGALLGSAAAQELERVHAPSPFADARVLAQFLLERGGLTPHQVNQILLGNGAGLVLGPYVVLDRLGEGGAGHVFKARHQKMGRIVAIKVIRKELVDDA